MLLLLVFNSRSLYNSLFCNWKGNSFDINWYLKYMWDKVFKNEPSKICGRQPLKNLKLYGLLYADHITAYVLKVVFHKFYLFHSWIPWPISVHFRYQFVSKFLHFQLQNIEFYSLLGNHLSSTIYLGPNRDNG